MWETNESEEFNNNGSVIVVATEETGSSEPNFQVKIAETEYNTLYQNYIYFILGSS